MLHNSCNMGTSGLPDMYTRCPRAAGPRAEGVHIRQTTRAHVTTIKYGQGIHNKGEFEYDSDHKKIHT